MQLFDPRDSRWSRSGKAEREENDQDERHLQNSKLTRSNLYPQRILSPSNVTGTWEDDEHYHAFDYVTWQKGDYPDGLGLIR